jgi:hypothetical protein
LNASQCRSQERLIAAALLEAERAAREVVLRFFLRGVAIAFAGYFLRGVVMLRLTL